MALMAASGSPLIALCPTCAAARWAAPLTVLVARLVQGPSAGGEFAAASACVVEIAPAGRKGLCSSALYVSDALGNLLAAGLGTVLTTPLTHSHMASWGWRIPFLRGAGLAGHAYVLRRRMTETHTAGERGRHEPDAQAPSVLPDRVRVRRHGPVLGGGRRARGTPRSARELRSPGLRGDPRVLRPHRHPPVKSAPARRHAPVKSAPARRPALVRHPAR